MKTVAIIQSNFLPWKGYFDIIHDVDLFIFYDDVQYTKNDWRNRNKVKLSTGTKWFTVPVKGHLNQKIYEVIIDQSKDWRKKHMNLLDAAFMKAPYYESYKDLIKKIYATDIYTLSDLNQGAIKLVSKELGIQTAFMDSRVFPSDQGKTDRLIDILSQVGADIYISGASAQNYIEIDKFRHAGVKLQYKNYMYPKYPQLFGEFVHGVTILDLLCNAGEQAPEYIWGGKTK